MKHIIKALLVLQVFTSSVALSQDPNFHIYLMFGQSNMEGAGSIQSQDRSNVDPRFQVMGATTCSTNSRSFTQGEWSTAEPPLVRCFSGLGVGDYFGRTMVEELPEHIKIGVVPVAVGGCDIILFDKDKYASYVESAPDWLKNIIDEYDGNPYGRLVDIAREAQKDGVIKGILFHQGETNTGSTIWKNQVKVVVDNLKEDLELDDIPFLAGELFAGDGACCDSHNVEVNKLPEVITNAHVISSEGLEGADEAHFTSAAYRTFGERYATKMLELIDYEENPIASLDDSQLADQHMIYPSPVVDGSFTIGNTTNIQEISVFDIMGNKVVSHQNTTSLASIEVRINTKPGIHLIRLMNGQKATYKKILIQ